MFIEPDGRTRALQRLKRLANGRFSPSVQYVYFDTNSSILEFYQGLADIDSGLHISSDSFYPIYSVTKTFTALAVLKLEEMGRLFINDPAYLHLPDFPYPHNITIRNLLTHSAGIPNPIPLSWIHLEHEHSTFPQNEFFDRLFKKHNQVLFAANENFKYSNLGYVLLGRLIEHVSEVPYDQFITNEIFRVIDPKIASLRFNAPGGSAHVTGYHNRFSLSYLLFSWLIDKQKFMGKAAGRWRSFNNFYMNGPAYGGVVSSADGLKKFLQEMLKQESLLLSAESKAKLFHENLLNNGRPSGMCLGWFTGRLKDIHYYAHAGGGGGYYCEARLYPHLGTGSIIFLNRTGMRDYRMLDSIDQFII